MLLKNVHLKLYMIATHNSMRAKRTAYQRRRNILHQFPNLKSNQVVARATRIWSVAEDETLIGLYLEISENAIKGTSQKATSLWRDVHAAYQLAHAEKPHILPPRPMKSLTSHWRRLAADTLQWISCYDEAGRLPEGGSGYNEADRIKSASKLFHLAQGRNFAFPHAVEMLNRDPKWRPKLRWSLSKEERKAVRDVEEQGSAGSGKRSRDDGGMKPLRMVFHLEEYNDPKV
ncbi:glutathione S-transferase T3-like [Chenopodium quinoa]|uniref:glutathione S-transferase T3-like n=1 Tax=Chenopodium quinoa TaxID=63459 RepID=UPI000B777235|nr:glutathione S-transferase T3-like [Chenopodium quinoa]